MKRLIVGVPVKAVYTADIVNVFFHYKGIEMSLGILNFRFEFRALINSYKGVNSLFRISDLENCEDIRWRYQCESDKEVFEGRFGKDKINNIFKELLSKRIAGVVFDLDSDITETNILKHKSIMERRPDYKIDYSVLFGPLGETIKFTYIDSDFYKDEYVLDSCRLLSDKEIKACCEDYLSGQQELDFS